jgi:hypothetical protein
VSKAFSISKIIAAQWVDMSQYIVFEI